MRRLVVFLTLILIVIAYLPAQEDRLPDWDFDSLFGESVEEKEPPPTKTETPPAQTQTPPAKTTPPKTESGSSGTTTTVNQLIRQRGLNLDLSNEFMAGIAPGWYEIPGESADLKDYYLDRLIKMYASISLDAQISSTFRTRSTISFVIPAFAFTLGDFFFDYTLFDKIFIRGGKYNLSWGISPNYNFTNLLARIPYEDIRFKNDSLIMKAEVPIGVGGFQVLTLTRANLLNSADANILKKEDIGYGAKYNLALRKVDMDLGMFYQIDMPFRGFVSLKTTVFNTELYSEGMVSFDTDHNISGAVSLGVTREFFDTKFKVNGELYYNTEKDALEYRPETNLRVAEVYPFVDGLNVALNLLYQFKDRWDFRLFTQIRYAISQNSAQLVPGFSLAPLKNIDIYFAVPMALGNEDGYYRINTLRTDTISTPETRWPDDYEGRPYGPYPLPLSVVLMITLKGGVQFSRYY